MLLLLDSVPSPVGNVLVVSDGDKVRALWFDEYADRLKAWIQRRYGPVEIQPARDPGGVSSKLRAYFDGDIHALSDVPAEPLGTPFQLRVWAALREIAPGETTSYGQLAVKLGMPTATRAVGMANGSNPVSLIIPCHRVIGTDGSLTGYGGGLNRKRWLLEHEGALAQRQLSASP